MGWRLEQTTRPHTTPTTTLFIYPRSVIPHLPLYNVMRCDAMHACKHVGAKRWRFPVFSSHSFFFAMGHETWIRGGLIRRGWTPFREGCGGGGGWRAGNSSLALPDLLMKLPFFVVGPLFSLVPFTKCRPAVSRAFLIPHSRRMHTRTHTDIRARAPSAKLDKAHRNVSRVVGNQGRTRPT